MICEGAMIGFIARNPHARILGSAARNTEFVPTDPSGHDDPAPHFTHREGLERNRRAK